MTTPDQPAHQTSGSDRPLEPSGIVTVHCDHDVHQDAPPNQAFVVIDEFWPDRIAIAALGGDGLERRNQPREWLRPESPAQLRQARHADGHIIYVVD
ncbi:hypothetical protein [Dactylosporangium matsuzakiense]|uniref:Uncharacterized protein n=1 Tax=Dactylosporangium matsuzakiense TaxID=53360 RepID=A0A9W6KP02_9ACTN|nr:hypothetical protein [Dactylosporangium matsuzakiense]UWZ44658.1 hypothetical protein Dmats_46220 [Dactylosporangium matsuzakiense]GLL04668.1 hypothetical protein GCM10017581_064150 [Dactylosporangium matsuzakiense]